MTQDLKPCPFCGKTITIAVTSAADLNCEDEDDFNVWPHSDSFAVMCNASRPNGPGGCGASGGFMPTEAGAITAWNRRASLASQPSQSHIGLVDRLSRAGIGYAQSLAGDDHRSELMAARNALLSALASQPSPDVAALAHEVWAMAQSPAPVEDAAALIAQAIAGHIASQPTIRDVRTVASQPAAGWLPIESAPKAGTSILLWAAGGINPLIGYWLFSRWFVSREHLTTDVDDGQIVDDLSGPITHWMPSPSPPAGEQMGGE